MIVTFNFQLSFLRYQRCFIVLYQKGPLYHSILGRIQDFSQNVILINILQFL